MLLQKLIAAGLLIAAFSIIVMAAVAPKLTTGWQMFLGFVAVVIGSLAGSVVYDVLRPDLTDVG